MANARALEPHGGAEEHKRSLDGVLAALAVGQHGIVARWQLYDLGFGRRAIGHRIERGRLHRLHGGVYAVGHRVLSREARWMAAVLAAGEGAVLSHRSAAAHWGIRQDTRGVTDVTVARALRSRPAITIHRARIAPDEVTIHEGIPVTTVPRTIFDLAARRPRREVERAIHEAEIRRLYDRLSLHDLVACYPNRQGIRTVRAILARRDAPLAITHQGLEERFVEFIERFRLPRPRWNQRLEIRGVVLEPDCVWHEQKVVVELDGRATHDTDLYYESDRVRDRKLRLADWTPVRVTWRQLTEEPEDLAAELRALLAC